MLKKVQEEIDCSNKDKNEQELDRLSKSTDWKLFHKKQTMDCGPGPGFKSSPRQFNKLYLCREEKTKVRDLPIFDNVIHAVKANKQSLLQIQKCINGQRRRGQRGSLYRNRDRHPWLIDWKKIDI